MKSKKLQIIFLSIVGASFLTSAVNAQDVTLSPLDTLTNSVVKLQSDVDVLKKIKISGYVQPQFQWADSAGIKSFAGGDFPAHVDKRFKVRRAEFKTMYDNGKTQIVANIDVTQEGINIKDAYGKFTEQWCKTFSLTAGIFNRPFGFEVPYSSGMLESPERARMSQIIFPGERDLGAMITFQLPVSSALHPLKIDAGMFNGTGNNVNDFDFQKDFIGNIHWTKTSKSEKVTYNIGGSFYKGGWANGNDTLYHNVQVQANGAVDYTKDVASSNKFAISKRIYFGGDGQLTIDWLIGITTLRAEYIQGMQPGTSSSSKSASTLPTAPTYVRNFNGAYLYFLQNIGQSKNQLIVKYDWYDPNTDVSGDEIGKSGTRLGATDIRYTTLGLGWAYRWDNNVKITAYYDKVENETSVNLKGFTHDLKDNVFTLRVQYKF